MDRLIFGPLEFEGFHLYINDMKQVIGGCHRCGKRYYNLYFSGHVKKGTKISSFEYGCFSGYDSNCICDEGPVEEVLCSILLSEDSEFLKNYLEKEDATRVIPYLRYPVKPRSFLK